MPTPRLITMDLSPARGPWLALGHGQAPPRVPRGFSPPRFTPEQQAANPDQQMTRLVKDVLRVGKWKVGVDQNGNPNLWDADHATLHALANAHQQAAARGVAMNLAKSHGNLATGIVPTDELIAPVDEVIVENGVLWASCYVTPEQARYLSNAACKVSPGIFHNWLDGAGNKYAMKMLHIAVTDNPVIPGQGPFVPMANQQQQQKGKTMDFAALVEQINALLERVQPGLSLPDDVSEETINLTLNVLVSALGGPAADTEPNAPGGGTEGEQPPVGLGMNNPASGRNGQSPRNDAPPAWATALIGQVKALSNSFATLQSGQAATAQKTYTDRVIALCNAGMPAREGQRLTTLGRQYNWDLSLLPAAAEDVPGKINTGSRAKALSNPNPPKIDGEREKPTDEECRAAAAKFYGATPAAKK